MKGIIRPAIALTVWFVLLTGFAFPFSIYGLAQGLFQHQANGSLVKNERGEVIGSACIGQTFAKPEYFHPRPSAADYDAANSGGTNLGPTSDKLLKGAHGFLGLEQLAHAYRVENGLAPNAEIPADAVTRSASGLDPDISLENALLQASRIAKARHVGEEKVRKLIGDVTRTRSLGFLGEPRVNVLEINRELDRMGR
jgi:K+-transporting ATPase ATPase C chain